MTDSGDPQPGRFSRLREILRLGRPRPDGLRPVGTVDFANRRVQLDVLRRAFGDQVALATSRDRVVRYLYHPRRALVRAADADAVAGFFAERTDIYRGSGSFDTVVDGELVLYELPPRHDGEVALLADLDELDRALGEGIATPDHVLYVVPKGGGYCPATEPLLPEGRSTSPVPALSRNRSDGTNVRVSVVDTGWYAPAAQNRATPWLATGVEGDEEQLQKSGTTEVIHEYAGHGTFVAGVIKCMAPATDIEIEGALTKGGAVYESDITAQLNEAMSDYEDDPRTPEHDPRPPHLISISAGTRTRNDLGLLGFQVLAMLHKWDQNETAALVVAAAGNDGSDAPFWPAAFDWVLSVGSLDADGKRSDFSNYGRWVDVWAHGRDLVNAFPTGEYTYIEPASGPLCGTKKTFAGLARWSGTSFATPVVTGAIAAYMSRHGCTARQARDALIGKPHVVKDPQLGNLKALGPPFVPDV
jgi:hypothetical protein